MSRHHDHAAPPPGHVHGTQDGPAGPGSHAHAHGPTQADWEALGTYLEQEAEIQRPLYAEACGWIASLVRAPGPRRVLDVGSGPGVLTGLLAEVFPAAEIVAVDSAPALLDRTRARAERLGAVARVSTRLAELPGGIGALGEADLIWAGNSVHHLGDQRAALEGLGRLLRPGGVLVLLEGGLAPRHLPRDLGFGRPGLEARLEALLADRFARMRSELPGTTRETEDWPALLAAAGLEPAGTRSFLLDLPAPLPAVVRDQILRVFTRYRETTAGELPAEDRAVLDRLVDPDDPKGLRLRPDLHLLSVRTVHTARKA